MKEMRSLLEKLSNAHGISGHEGNICELVRAELKPYVDETRVDSLGNLIATKKGSSPSVMLAAHMDEIGLMVKCVEDSGFIRFVKVGGWFDQTLLNQRVILHSKKGPLVGVIGSKPPHKMEAEEAKRVVKADDMFIDVGVSSKKDAEKLGAIPGVPITIDREFRTLTDNMVTGKAFDNRAGLVMMIEALKRTKAKSTIYAVGTVQEEVGLKGAKTSAFGLSPDVALATDITIAGDHPGIEKKDSSIEIGKGPSITVMDAAGRGIITPAPVLRWLEETAKKNKIPYQLDVSDGGTTDATAIQLTKAGIPSGTLSLPMRYAHSPVEVLSLKDLDTCAELMARALETMSNYFRA
ncbi:MAG: M42 family metallopeptidase [Methanosarcinales archaeon]|nr:MAG: M42 family metallopeptidase [Methanosarcinales archaeon]